MVVAEGEVTRAQELLQMGDMELGGRAFHPLNGRMGKTLQTSILNPNLLDCSVGF